MPRPAARPGSVRARRLRRTAIATAPIRRIVTGHDSAGKAVFQSDEVFEPQLIPSGDARFALLWTTASAPADNDDDTDGRTRPAGLTMPGGSVIRIVEMLPGGTSPMHRTDSVDYGIVLEGSVECELDDGAKTVVNAGDVIVQRGTMHLWRNAGDVTARIVFVLIDATARTVDGKPLPAVLPH